MRQDYRFYPYQHLVTQRRTVNDSAMPDGTFITNCERRAWIYMKRAIILDVRPATDDDRRGIGAYDGVVPDTRAFMDGDVANYHRAGGYKDVFFYGRPYALVR